MDHHRRSQRQHRSRGASAVEYGVLIALVAGVILGAVRLIGTATADSFADPLAASVNDGLPTCSTEERQAYLAEWIPHRDTRTELRADGNWYGRSNRDTRIAWNERRTEIMARRSAYGC